MKKIDDELIGSLTERAKNTKRKRVNLNFHPFPESLLQRMLNAMEPETYIQPHKHENPDKVEVFFCLRGRLLVVEYSDDGKVSDHIVLDASKGNYGCEIAPRTWHSIISLESGSIAYEVKDGPYNPDDDKKFAPWAPAETQLNAIEFNHKIIKLLDIDT